MLPTIDDLELCIRTVHKHLDLSLRICHRVHHIGGAMKPQHRTYHIRQSSMQAITISKIDSSHASTFSTFFTDIIVCNFLAPEITDGADAVFAEPDVDKKIGEVVAWAEVVICRFTPTIDDRSEIFWGIPAAQFAGLG